MHRARLVRRRRRRRRRRRYAGALITGSPGGM
jgi:hypothetical protein